MTLSPAELLRGAAAALSVQPPPESAGDFMAGTIGAVALIALLAAQDIETAAARRYAENKRIRALFRMAIETGAAGAQEAALSDLAAEIDSLTLSALDEANDRLLAALIGLHRHAEEKGIAGLERAILHHLATTATDNVLTLP